MSLHTVQNTELTKRVCLTRSLLSLLNSRLKIKWIGLKQGHTLGVTNTELNLYTVRLEMNGTVSKVNKKFISHLTRARRTPSAAATVPVSHALPAVRFSCLLRGRGASFQDRVAAEKGFLYAPF